jgi:hypothetical protein
VLWLRQHGYILYIRIHVCSYKLAWFRIICAHEQEQQQGTYYHPRAKKCIGERYMHTRRRCHAHARTSVSSGRPLLSSAF